IYKSFFGLNEPPFNLTPDPRFFFFSKKHEEALSHILLGIQERRGFIVITGEVGTGKTTLCRLLLQRVDPKIKTSLLFNANMGTIELLQAINQDFGLPGIKRTKKGLVDELNRFLLDGLAKGENALLIIDEAQSLSIKAMEEIRLLSNLETEREKLLQILLIGQPELKENLALNELRQLNQRITLRYDIPPLELSETAEYVKTRMIAAGETDQTFWSSSAIERIFQFSGGVPRLINVAADRALLAAYVAGTKVINDEIVQKGLAELSEVGKGSAGANRRTPSFRLFSGGTKRFLSRLGIAFAVALLLFAGWRYFSSSLSSFLSGSASSVVPSGGSAQSGEEGSVENFPVESPTAAVLDSPQSDPDTSDSSVIPPSFDVKPDESDAPSTRDPFSAASSDGGVEAKKESGGDSSKEAAPVVPATSEDPEGFDTGGVYRVNSPENSRPAAYLTLLNLWGKVPAEVPSLSSNPDEWMEPAHLREYRFPLSLSRVSYLDYPLLFQLSDPDGAHYVVLARLNGKNAFLLDPLFGPETIPASELQTRWVGEGILFWEGLQGVEGALPERGEPVKRVQEVLSREGLFPADSIDGVLGPRTRQAILNFQTRVGLKPVGVFDTETHLVLARWVSATPLPGLNQARNQ
ncbi:MAG TPA: AAA family ATPase, partial [Nitrospiria bacterium]|nr:AAA family ATPase [Nitrospiria bacterium]